MQAYNPYAAPNAGYAPPQYSHDPAVQRTYGETYVPLGWRMALASIGIVGVALFSVAVDLSNIAFGDKLASTDEGVPDLGAAAILGLSGVGLILSMIFAAVFFSVWIYRAAANLRGLGRYGMQFSPGGCVGWFFVPFANLVRPFKAMSEVWRASDAQGDGAGWMMTAATPLLGLWWGSYLLGGIVGNISGRIDEPSTSGSVGLLGSVLWLVAAVCVILLMKSVGDRQAAAASRPPSAAGAAPAQRAPWWSGGV